MKILHTSDWHLGQNFYGYDRFEEHKSFLDQITAIVGREQPDAMVVCGDIFHNYTPPAQAQRLYTESLVAMHTACPGMVIVVTAGNHDSATRLEVDSDLWQLANVHVVGRLRHADDGSIDFSRHVIPIADKGLVVALPYIFSQSYPPAPDGGDARRYFFSQLNDFVDAHNPHGLPVVLMAHLAVQGSDLRGQRLKGLTDSVGGLDFMPADDFGPAFDYVALGHIHHPQTIAGSHHRVRYCGSPIPVSFDEDYTHSVTMVTVSHGGEPRIDSEDFKITNPCPLYTIPKEPMRTPLAIDALQKEAPGLGKCYVRLNPVERHAFPVTMEEDAITTLRAVNPEARYTTFVPNITKSSAIAARQPDITPEQLGSMEPIDVARQYFDMTERNFSDYEGLFREVINRINKEDAQ